MNRQASLKTSALRLLVAMLALLWGAAAHAQLPPGGKAMAVTLVAETATPAAGGTVMLALVMKPHPGWHGYWKNPGDAGVETLVKWNLPKGVEAGPLQYPVPERLIVAGMMNYVYRGEYAHLVPVTLPAGLAVGTRLPLRAHVDYLVCTDKICVPETADVAADLIVGAKGQPGMRNPGFDRYRSALPKPLGAEARYQLAGGRLRLAIPLPASIDAGDAYFFPLTQSALAYAAPQKIGRSGDQLIVETEAGSGASSTGTIEGVLGLGNRLGLSLTARPGAVPAVEDRASARKQTGGSVLAALGGAILGGLLLNLMPCIFPILSLKALSLAGAGSASEGRARREALAYASGVILTCLALGGALLALRAGGAAVGWAFLLQDPRTILFLLLIVVAIALNLAGAFELPAITAGHRLAATGGTMGAFWTGALAAFIGTPCSGPFMAAALGAALFMPIPAALAIFAGLGFGLALPFLLIGFVPAIRRRLPKSGAWMGTLRRILSVPMFATALWLGWVLAAQTGRNGLVLGIAVALLLALALWWAGRRQGRPGAWLPLAPAMLAGLAAILVMPALGAPAAASVKGDLGGEPFSETRLASLRAAGRPVFVYFTADWCLTCKVNEHGALASADVARSFAARHVAVLVGDWTNGDAAISRFLEKQGRSGVPLYLYYAPGKPAEMLPQLLTAGRLTGLGR
jgi:thiol:disulfide interchange protein